MDTSLPPDAPIAAPAPSQPEPLEAGPASGRRYFLPGFGILVACLLTGEWLKQAARTDPSGKHPRTVYPACLARGPGWVPLRWVESAARLLLWLLPFLFMPIFILAMSDKAFWAVQGRTLAGAVIAGMGLLWVFVGHLSQRLLKRHDNEYPQ